MKIQYLAVIFVIIIMPIIIVFSEYMNTQMNIVKTEQAYDSKLFASTHDSLNAFQINTINSMLYTPESRVVNIEAAVNTFFNSLVTSFQFDGNLSNVMKEYIPAVVYTMYDGYYIYSPFQNTLTEIDKDSIDDEYNKPILNGLKPYVSYSCRYNYNNKEYIITYSMDNYIYVDILDGNKHETKDGYLLNGVSKSGDSYIYDGIEFKKGDNEVLRETISGKENEKSKLYYYALLDGTKYFYGGTNNTGDPTKCSDNDYIFYIDDKREICKQVYSRKNKEDEFDKYYTKIFHNNSAYLYYKESFEFTQWVKNNLGGLSKANIIESENYSGYEFQNVGNIFDGDIEYSNSNFNKHRADVIRAVITTNLSSAISGFKKYTNSESEFIMPKISETDWELLENNVCIATFMQGLKVGDKTYNSYAVIPNNFTKEYVDENDIYILKNDNTYSRSNDKTLLDTNAIKDDSLGFKPGLLKINFEKRQDKDENYYNPITFNGNPYLQSYTSFSGTSDIDSVYQSDMYRYIKDKANDRLKKVYYTALGREKYGSFKYTMYGLDELLNN